jgi:hypothetical protein
LQAQSFHGFGIRVGRHFDRVDADHCTPPKRQIDGGAVPVVQADEPAGHHRERQDRPSGFPRQHDDAEAGDARALRHVGRQRHVVALFERTHHFLERADAALAVERRAVIAGPAHGLDAEPFGDDGVEFAVAMPRHQHFCAMIVFGLDKGRQEMLAVPEREDQRLMRLGPFIDVGRFERECVGAPDQPQIFRDEEADGLLEPAGAQQAAKQFFQRGFTSWPDRAAGADAR